MVRWSSVSPSVVPQRMQHLNCWDTKPMDQKWTSGACEILTTQRVVQLLLFICTLQWSEHVRYAYWTTTLHSGTIQHRGTSCKNA